MCYGSDVAAAAKAIFLWSRGPILALIGRYAYFNFGWIGFPCIRNAFGL